jgi:hypothetical protein
MRSPPAACTLTIHTPCAAAARKAPATVLGMSYHFRSRNTRPPVLVHQIDGGRPGAGEQHRPDLERPDAAGERPDQRPRLFQVGHVEADDQPLGW